MVQLVGEPHPLHWLRYRSGSPEWEYGPSRQYPHAGGPIETCRLYDKENDYKRNEGADTLFNVFQPIPDSKLTLTMRRALVVSFRQIRPI